MQCLAFSLNSGRLPLGREALLLLQPQLLLLKSYPLLLNLELSLKLPRDRLPPVLFSVGALFAWAATATHVIAPVTHPD
jgi:hypothetical protein